MKGLQNLISRYLKDHEKRKKYLAVVLTLSIIVTFVVPMSLIMPAISMTNNTGDSVQAEQMSLYKGADLMLQNAAGTNGNEAGGDVYSPAEMSAKVLLIGTNPSNSGDKDWAKDCTTPEEVIAAAKDEFFLGIAHDFCAFIEGDFEPKAADAEGRVAIGGDFTFISDTCKWNYQVGSGDYGSATSLNNTLYYKDNTGYAHAIVGGKIVNINTASTGSGVKKYHGTGKYDASSGYHTVNRSSEYSYTFFYKPEEDLFKRFVVGNVGDSYHYEYPSNDSVPYSSDHMHDYPGDCETDEDGEDELHPYLGHVNEKAQLYQQPDGGLINFENEFNWMRKRSKSLADTTSTGTTTRNGSELIFECPDGTQAGDTVYFDMPDGWADNYYDNIKFKNVPVGEFKDSFGETVDNYPLCNLVVNCGGSHFQIGAKDTIVDKIDTWIIGTDGTTGSNEAITLYGNDGSNTSDNKKNNHPASEKILYNFYEATSGQITTNFNGTVFAPFADVKTPNGKNGNQAAAGHLSGALIAKSFWGYLEFGYRPYRGLGDIVNLSSSYSIHVDKFIADTDKETFLPGALFQLAENSEYTVSAATQNESNEETKISDKPYVYSWNSANSSVHVPFPTAVDFSGQTDYKALAEELFRPPETTTTVIVTTEENTTTTAVVTTEEDITTTVAAQENENEEAQSRQSDSEETLPPETENNGDVSQENGGEATPVQENDSEEISPHENEGGDDSNQDTGTQDKIERYTIIKTYTMGEESAPAGFFKDEKTSYRITVSETVDLSMLQNNVPQKVSVRLDTTRITKNDDGTDTEYSLPRCDMVIENIDGARLITVEGYDADGNQFTDEFKLNINDAQKKISSVDKKYNGSWRTVITAESDTNTDEYEIDGRKYCFDPEVIMMMPLPDEEPSFENKPALIFKKVNDLGATVKDADITVSPPIDGFNPSSGECIIDPEKLTLGIEYIITENQPPDKLEKADPIHFKLTCTKNDEGIISDYKVEYWSVGDDEKESVHKYLDLLNASASQHMITMVDNRKLGAKLTLKKVDFETREELDCATFSIYAENDTLVCSGLDGKGNIFDNENFKNLDSKYARNGYLFPGVYYLTEDTIPEHPDKDKGETYKNPGRIYFTVVKDDFSVISGRKLNQSIDLKDVNGGCQYYVYIGETQLNNKDVSINNVKSFVIKVEPEPLIYLTIDGDDATIHGSELEKPNEDDNTYTKTFENPVTITKFEIQKDGGWGNINPSYIEFVTDSGVKYIYDKNASGAGDSAMADENPMLLEVNGSTLKIGNEKEADKKDITVSKKWANDKAFADLRADSITVQLYQSKTELTDPKTKLTADMAYEDENGDSLTAVLNEANNWTATWTGLESKYLEGDVKKPYYYYIKEIDVPTGYNDTYSVAPDGTLVVTNTLDTISVNIQKKWDTKQFAVKLPVNVTFTIQQKEKSDTSDDWRDVQTVTLTANNKTADYTWGKAVQLPAGYDYRIVEDSVPSGWKTSAGNPSASVSKDRETLSITNEIILSSLVITKNWENDTASNRPGYVKFAIYRTTTKNTTDLIPSPTGPLWPTQEYYDSINALADEPELSVQNDYARLLQYSLFFYDGVMCGDDVDENSNYYWRGDCHTEDEIPGGFHDAGDHVMFGLPAGFSASNLGWSLYEFRPDYDDLGQTKHTKLITDYYSEFFSKCIRDNNGTTEILVQKGHGNTDHAYWGIPELQESRMDAIDISSDKIVNSPTTTKLDNQMYWRSDTGSDIAANYAASLALSYLNFHTTDEDKYTQYLEKAKQLYKFAKDHSGKPLNEWGVNKDEWDGNEYPGFYASDGDQDERAWAASWLALACKEKYGEDSDDYRSYKNDANTLAGTLNNAWGGYHWNNIHTGAILVNAAYLGGSWDKVNDFVKDECTGTGYKATSSEWGQTRYNCGYQTIALAAAKHPESGVNVDNVKSWCKSQMNYILGDACGTCLVTNFSENSTQKPHFRAGSGEDCGMEEKDDPNIINGYDADVFRLIGGMVGGPWHAGDAYTDSRSDYKANEVASDYNANLVGAAAGLYHFFGTGYTYEIPGVKNSYNGKSKSIEAQPEALVQSIIESPRLMMAKAVSIRDAENDNYIEFSDTQNSDVFNIICNSNRDGSGADVSSYTLGKKVTKIELSYGSNAIALRLNGKDFNWNDGSNVSPSLNYANGVLIFEPIEQNGTLVYKGIWGAPDVPYDQITHFSCIWNKPGYIRFYFEAENTFKIIPESTKLAPGGSTKLTIEGLEESDGEITWTIPQNGGTITNNGDGTYTYTAGDNTSGTINISGTAGEKNGSFELEVSAFAVNNTPIKLHVGKTARISLNASGDITYTVKDSSIAEISDDGIITAKSIGTTTFTATRNGVTASGTIEIIDDLEITGITQMSQNKTTKLTVKNNVGNVSWISSDETIATVDENGNVRSLKEGEVVITAFDTGDKTSATHKIEIKETAETVDVTGMEYVKTIELTAKYSTAENVWSYTVPDLPIRDENNKLYYYYIVEVDDNGVPVTQIKGNSAVYIPLNYTGNGQTLKEDDETPVNFSVTNKKPGETKGELPSAGGAGTKGFQAAGMVIMFSATAGYYLIRRRRRRVTK